MSCVYLIFQWSSYRWLWFCGRFLPLRSVGVEYMRRFPYSIPKICPSQWVPSVASVGPWWCHTGLIHYEESLNVSCLRRAPILVGLPSGCSIDIPIRCTLNVQRCVSLFAGSVANKYKDHKQMMNHQGYWPYPVSARTHCMWYIYRPSLHLQLFSYLPWWDVCFHVLVSIRWGSRPLHSASWFSWHPRLVWSYGPGTVSIFSWPVPALGLVGLLSSLLNSRPNPIVVLYTTNHPAAWLSFYRSPTKHGFDWILGTYENNVSQIRHGCSFHEFWHIKPHKPACFRKFSIALITLEHS